jgi:hypothetical protein
MAMRVPVFRTRWELGPYGPNRFDPDFLASEITSLHADASDAQAYMHAWGLSWLGVLVNLQHDQHDLRLAQNRYADWLES